MPWYSRWWNVLRPQAVEDEIRKEFEYHLAETLDRLVDEGMPEHEALQLARRRLGNPALQKERTRDMNISATLDAMRADIIYGLRQLRANPSFTAIAVISLALGTGANTAIFQLVNAIQLKTLPVANPAELTSIDFAPGATRAGWWPARGATMSYPEWEQIRDHQEAFTGVLAWSGARFNLASGGEPRLAEGLFVSGDFFYLLGVGTILGRPLTIANDNDTCEPGAVLSHAFWQREFGGDPGVLGRTVSLNGHPIPIIGVTQPAFFGLAVGNRFDVAIPLCADRLLAESTSALRISKRDAFWLSAMGRLKPGWTLERASAHLRHLSQEVMRATVPSGYRPDMAKTYLENKLIALPAATGVSGLRRQYERPLWVLLAATGLVLLIACANLASLLLARATARQTEIAVRLAIGASRRRLIAQLLTESLLLAIAGAALGAVLAAALSRALIDFISSTDDPLFVDLALDWRMLGFTVGLSVLTCLLFGLLPAFRATALAPVAAMRGSSRSVTAGHERLTFRRALVSAQVALSLILLFGALLFVRSLHNLMVVDTGFQTEGIITVTVDFSKEPMPREKRFALDSDLSARLAGVPGVLAVAQISFPPMSGSWDNLVAPDGASAATNGRSCFFNQAGPGYFKTMGTPLLAGREFDDRDTLATPKVAIVNEVFARRFLAGANPVGHTFHMAAESGHPEPQYQIVGMVKNTKYAMLREDFEPIAFFPMGQDENRSSNSTFVMRIAGLPGPLVNNAKAAVAAMSSSIGIQIRPLSAQLTQSLSREKLMATLSACFGLLAGLLTTFGLYGVISYTVASRRNEIGVRIALGAGQSHVVRLVLRETAVMLSVGLATGVVLALWAGRAATALLFGLQPSDAISLVAASTLLAVTAAIASYIPARRAASLDPSVALRTD